MNEGVCEAPTHKPLVVEAAVSGKRIKLENFVYRFYRL